MGDWLMKEVLELRQENKALSQALNQERIDHDCTKKALENLHDRDDERITKAQLLLDEEKEALILWGKSLKPAFDPFIDDRPDLYLDYKRFNQILDGLTVDGSC